MRILEPSSAPSHIAMDDFELPKAVVARIIKSAVRTVPKPRSLPLA